MPTTTTDPETEYQPRRPAEFAPSDVAADEPTMARAVGGLGIAAAVLGTVAVVANQFGPRWISPGTGYLLGAAGVAAMLYHAVRDSDLEFRRAYGLLATVLLAVALVLFAVPGPQGGGEADRRVGYYLLPWGASAGLLSLLFFIPFVRNEADPRFRSYGLTVMLAAGAALAAGSVVAGVAAPDTLVGTGVVLALLGLGFLSAYLAQVSTDDGVGHLVAVLIGVLGAAAVAYAVGRAAFPTVLFEGPGALKNAYQTYDRWKVAARAVTVLFFLGIAAAGARGRGMPWWVRAGLAVVGVGFAGVFVAGSFAAPVTQAPRPFLVPAGLILMGIGVVYLALSLGTVSDSPFVVMTRRELDGFFYSPIAYVVLFGMTLLQWIGYLLYVKAFLDRSGSLGAPPPMEPILKDYLPGTLIGPLVVIMFVPILTMRLFSEEKRTGAMEVLLTAPVGEWSIVLSKFLACWLFYLLNWLPMGLYLIALRAEGGRPFDYRPLLSLYVAVGVSGLAFVGMGLFFSSLTRNQIIAAVLTGAGMLILFMLTWHEAIPLEYAGLRTTLGAVARVSYWRLWQSSLSGQLLLRDLLLQASMAVFWVFLTVKSLETRKWR